MSCLAGSFFFFLLLIDTENIINERKRLQVTLRRRESWRLQDLFSRLLSKHFWLKIRCSCFIYLVIFNFEWDTSCFESFDVLDI